MKKKTSIFIFWFILVFTQVFNTATSQEKSIDSLKKYSSDSLKSLSRVHRYSNPTLAKIYAKKLFDRGVSNNNLSDMAWGYHQLGLVDEVLGNYKESILQYNKGIEISKTINDSILLIDLYLVKGSSYLYLKEYEKVLFNYNTALNISKKIKNRIYEITSNACIAYLKKELGLLKEALEIEKYNIKISENIDFPNQTAAINLIMNLGETYLALQENDSAIFYSNKALGKSLLVDNVEGTAYIYKTIGIAYHNKKEYARALRNYGEAIEIISPFGKDLLLAELYYHEALSYQEQKNIGKAISSLKKAEEVLLKENVSAIQFLEIYKSLAKNYKTIDNHKKSALYFEKYVALDNTRDETNLKVIGELHTTNIKAKDESITQLSSKQNQLKKRYSNTFYILGVTCLLIILAFMFYIFRTQKNKRTFQKLLAKNNSKERRKNPKIIISDQKAVEILKQLKKLEQKHAFLKQEFSLTSAAKKIKTNPSYLSRVINVYLHKKFQDYVNELRIEYSVSRLQEDKKFRSYSIAHIANEVGYKSPNSFTKHFKNQTGIYPSFFISKLRKSM